MSPSPKPAAADLILIGGGEHARVVLDAARRSGRWRLAGYFDPMRSPELDRLDVPYLGDDPEARSWPLETSLIIATGALGDRSLRQRLVERYGDADVSWATVIHPDAVVAQGAIIGNGVVILAGSIVNPGARIGDHATINTAAVVEHDVEIGPFVHVAPGAVIGGGAAVGAGALVGLGARIRDHVEIGEDAVIGMGAVVVASVEPRSTVVGVPARPLHGPAVTSG